MARKIVLLVAGLCLEGCVPEYGLVIKDPPQKSPSMCIIPSAYTRYDLKFAAQVEYAIMLAGIRMVERPQFRFTEIQEETGKTTSSNDNQKSTRHEMTADFVTMYHEARSDYIAVTYADSSIVRIVRFNDLQVMATTKLFHGDQDFNDRMKIFLTRAGFKPSGVKGEGQGPMFRIPGISK